MELTRAHGLGNDYLVLDEGPALTPDVVVQICDRHRGVGGDGILEPQHSARADFGVRIWNPDGSVAEKSGNGLRIFARWLRDHDAPASFTVDTGTDVVRCTVRSDGVSVEMGRATLVPALVPHTGEAEWTDHALTVGTHTLHVTALALGNPHCVVWRDEEQLDALPWREWGEHLETADVFPNRINVQVARVIDRSTVEIRIWERGAGVTLASGSSSCGVAASGVRTGRLDPGRIEVRMPGGVLFVTVSSELDLLLEGPVEVVGTLHVDPRWMEARGLVPRAARTLRSSRRPE